MTDHNGVQSYLKRLRWALSHLPAEDREEIVTETRAHFSERMAQGTGFETVAASFGDPEAYARRFLENYEISVALSSGSTPRMMGAALKAIGRGVGSFFAVLGLVTLYLTALVFVVIAVLKPLMPEHTGLWVGDGLFLMGVVSEKTVAGMGMAGEYANAREVLGYWIIPLSLVAGAVVYLLSNTMLRRFLKRIRRGADGAL